MADAFDEAWRPIYHASKLLGRRLTASYHAFPFPAAPTRAAMRGLGLPIYLEVQTYTDTGSGTLRQLLDDLHPGPAAPFHQVPDRGPAQQLRAFILIAGRRRSQKAARKGLPERA